MKNRDSLIFKIHLLTTILTLLIIISVSSIFLVIYFNEKRIEAKKAIKIYNNITMMQTLKYTKVENTKEKNSVDKYAKNLLIDNEMINIFASGNIKLLTYNQYYYIYFKKQNIYLKSTYKISSLLQYVALFLFIVIFLIYGLIRYIKVSIVPLKELVLNIQKFENGNLDIDTRTDKKDEVAKVGNAFYKALLSLKNLEKSRTLFIRNISHELKTPLTKNNLIVHKLKNINLTDKEKLLQNNNQMNTIIETLNQFESLQSKHLTLNKKMFNTLDLIEEAIELTEIEDENIELVIKSSSKENVDFEKFVLVLKNLIINAYIHSNKEKIIIEVDKKSIRIKNISIENMSLDLEEICKPFVQLKENNSGMGLGMYIIDTLLQMHHLQLKYQFKEKYHIFEIFLA